MATTTTPDYPKGLTFEKVWAMFQETDRKFQETDRKFQETDRKIQETDRLMKEQIKETDRRLKEAERLIAENGEQIGGLHNSFGEIAEHLVAPGIAQRFNELGFHFDGISPGGFKILDEQKKKVKAEVDLLLENDDTMIAIEVKTRVVQKDIERHIKRLEIFKEYRSKKKDTRKIYGAIAAAVFGSVEKKAALEAGFYVLEQSGDTMKLELPDGFIPREW